MRMCDGTIDPIDFFPTYHLCQIPRNNSKCPEWLSHMFALLLGVLICLGGCYYYTNVYTTINLNEETVSLSDIENNINTYHGQINTILKEMKILADKVENTNIWRNHIDHIFTKTYVQELAIVEKKIQKAIDRYDADKIGLFDYAAQYAGGSIDSFPDTCPYPSNKSVSFLNLLSFTLNSNPDIILQPNSLPSSCFAFHGDKGRIRIKLGRKISIAAVTMEHSPLSLQDDPTSAPREFEIYGLTHEFDEIGLFLGRFVYDIESRPYQTFNVQFGRDKQFDYIELKVLNNHGKKQYTCIYRFRVHKEHYSSLFENLCN